MSMNKGKKIGAAAALAAMFAGGSVSGSNFRGAILGAFGTGIGLGILDAGFNISPWNLIKEKAGAPEGLWKKLTGNNKQAPNAENGGK